MTKEIHRDHRYRLPAAIVWLLVTVFLSSYVILLQSKSRFEPQANDPVMAEEFNENADHSSASTEKELTLRPGDLPGYTGWSRPSETLAGWFDPPVAFDKDPPGVGRNATFRVHCGHAACSHGGSLFFVRAYGRAVLPGRVTDHRNGTYDMVVFPLDDGLYHLEVVLAFSNPPPFDEFPLLGKPEPAYEGYLLPGFPLPFQVHPNDGIHPSQLPPCSTQDLLDTTQESAVEKGRWKVDYKVSSRLSSYSSKPDKKKVSLSRYQKGESSLGVRMSYAPQSCSLLPANELRQALVGCKKGIHMIYIGDSNMRMQQKLFTGDGWSVIEEGQSMIETTHIPTNDGLHSRLSQIARTLQELEQEALHNDDKDYFILFNAGLHDISQLCAQPNAPNNVSCSYQYQVTLRKLAQLVDAFPAKLKVFQTTTAGWPKYGNYGFAWPPQKAQTLPRDPTFVAHFNQIAWQILSRRNSSFILDAYWLTLARPDHRQVDKDNAIGKHLVHAGVEVLDVLVRQWVTMVVESACA